jgi:cytochrome P450
MIIVCSHLIHYDPEFYSCPEKFDPERFMDATTVPRHAWKPFGAGPQACLGKDLAMDELRVIVLLTVRSFDFECADLKPNPTPRVSWTDLDLRIGDLAFQQLGLEARPRDKAMMRVFRAVGR